MNKAIIMGRLTKDIDIRNADTDKKVARGTLAVNRNYKKEGEDQAADFINLVAFGKQADLLWRTTLPVVNGGVVFCYNLKS